MSHLRNGMVEAAKRLGVHPGVLVPLGGAASEVFAAGDKVLRIGTPEVIDVELAASAAASKVIPVPSVLAREDAAGEAAVLLERMAGTPAWHPGLSDTTARRRGRACGNLHALMATIDPPPGVPSIEIGALPAAPARLLHLDEPMGGDIWHQSRAADVDADRAVRADAAQLADRMKRAQRVRPGKKHNRKVRSAEVDRDPMHHTSNAQTTAREEPMNEAIGDEIIWERGGGFSLLTDDDGVWERLT